MGWEYIFTKLPEQTMCGIGFIHDKLIINKGLLVLKDVIRFPRRWHLFKTWIIWIKQGLILLDFGSSAVTFLDSRWRPTGYMSSFCSQTHRSHPSFSSCDRSVNRICATTASPSSCWSQGQCGEFKTQIIAKIQSAFDANRQPISRQPSPCSVFTLYRRFF